MSTDIPGVQRAFVLWVSGARLADVNALAEVEKLKSRGALVELEPLPITGPRAQHYQLLSGQSPANFGFFDTIMPSCMLPQWQRNNGYEVAETDSGHNAAPEMLPDLLRAAGWDLTFEETEPTQLVDCVRGLTELEVTPDAPICHIVKCTISMTGQSRMQTAARLQAIGEALHAASSWAGQNGLLAMLSDIQPTPVEHYININNFLAEMGILNRDEQSGLIDWPNSLAYYAGHGQIWINVLGRDPQGVVHPQGEYEGVRDTLVTVLLTKLRDDESGMPVLERIYRKEELYPEKYLYCAPDLVVVFKPGYTPSPASTCLEFDEMMCITPVEGSMTMAGAHPSTLRGFLLMSAPSIISGSTLPESALLTSAFPTLLHALGVEYSGMGSPVLSELFLPTYLETQPIRAALKDEELSEEDEELIINRLRDLGYVKSEKMSDRLKRSPWLPSQLSLPQTDSTPSVGREHFLYEVELKNAPETPPSEKIIPSWFLPSNTPKKTREVSSEGYVIPPRISLKQRGGWVYAPRRQFRKIHEEESHRLYMPVSEIVGFSSDLIDTQEFIAVGFNRGEDYGSSSAFDWQETVPMMVLQGIASQQGQSVPQLQSEISGTASNAALIGVGNIAGNVIKYGNNLLIQRGFGPGPYGLYALGMSIVGLFVAVFNVGLDDAMVRYVAMYRAKKRAALLRGLALFCTLLCGLAGILGAIVMLYFAPSLAVIKNAKDAAYVFPILLLMAPLIPLMSMQAIWSSGLQGFKAFKSRILLQRLLVPSSLTVLLLIVLIFFRGNILAVVMASLISTLFSALLNLSFFSRMVSRFSGRVNPAYELREWLSFALPNFLTSIIDTVLDATDTLLLAFLVVSPIALGQYAAANKISNFISMPLITLNVTFAPTIAELFSKGEKEKLDLMFQMVTKWIISFSLPLCLICMLFSQSLLSISGKGFVAAWPLLIALAAGNMMNAGTGPVGYMLLMTGHQRLSFINSIVAVAVNVLLGIFLTTRFGAMGTAIATGLALAIVNLMRLLQVRLLLHIHPYRPDTIKPILAGLISTLMIGALLYLFSLAHMSMELFGKTLSIQLLLVPVFLACYALLIILFQVSPEDKLVLDKLRSKFGRKHKKKGV